MTQKNQIQNNYLQTLEEIKQKVKTSQIKAHLSVNKEMLILYWQIGKIIIEQREAQQWGSKVIEQLAKDLKSEFGTMKGLSITNLKYMALFAESYPDLLMINQQKQIGQQSADQLENNENPISHQAGDQLQQEYFINDRLSVFVNIPWRHNVEIFTKIKDQKQRLWYAQQIIKNGWSRNVLAIFIKSGLYLRQTDENKKINNFKIILPENHSDLANDVIKGEYKFEFINNDPNKLKERALESALIDDVVKFLIELGSGFAFVGKQYHIEASQDDYYIDILCYHLELRSFIVIELKTTKFKPEYAGKMAFYLSQIDKKLKKPTDNDSIGIILCSDTGSQESQDVINCITKPMGVAGYELAQDKKDLLVEELKPLKDLVKNHEKDKL